MASPLHFRASDSVSRTLSAVDPALARVIERVGAVDAPDAPDPFAVLARAVIGQQLSDAAAGAISTRVAETIGESAEAFLSATDEAWRAAGVSRRKVSFLRGLAEAATNGALDLSSLAGLDDDAIGVALERFPGVGPWTVQTFLLFGLGRPDVIVLDDAGVRAAAGRMYGLGRPATRAELAAAAERWRPHRSAATLYLYNDGRPRTPEGTT